MRAYVQQRVVGILGSGRAVVQGCAAGASNIHPLVLNDNVPAYCSDHEERQKGSHGHVCGLMPVPMHLHGLAAPSTGTGAAWHANGLRTFASGPSPFQKKFNEQFGGLKPSLPPNPFDKRRLGPAVPKMVLYRGPFMLPFRFLVRAKVFQLAGVFAGGVLLTTMFTAQSMSTTHIVCTLAVMFGCVATSYCIAFYSGRYVGELSLLLPEQRVARFSVLDFWGNRWDNDVPVERIEPPFKNRSVAEVRALVAHPLLPVQVTGDRQYFISVRHGKLVNKDVLQKICYGSWLPELDGLPVVPLNTVQLPQQPTNTDAPTPTASSPQGAGGQEAGAAGPESHAAGSAPGAVSAPQPAAGAPPQGVQGVQAQQAGAGQQPGQQRQSS